VTLSASDPSPGSGVSGTYYQVDGGAVQTYSGAFTVSATGYHVIAYYSRDVAGNYETTKSVSFWIKSPTTTVVTSSVNPSAFHQSVTFKAAVTPSFGSTPLGNVLFKNNGVVIGTVALSGGVASFTTSALAVGSHAINAVFEGSGNDIASPSAAITQTVHQAATTTTIVSSVNPSNAGQAVTFTATIKPAFGGAATGTVNFKNGTTIIGTRTVSAANKATFTTSTLAAGTHAISAVYTGNTNLKSSFSTAVKQVVK